MCSVRHFIPFERPQIKNSKAVHTVIPILAEIMYLAAGGHPPQWVSGYSLEQLWLYLCYISPPVMLPPLCWQCEMHLWYLLRPGHNMSSTSLELEPGRFTAPESQAATTDSPSWWTGYQGDHRKQLITAQHGKLHDQRVPQGLKQQWVGACYLHVRYTQWCPLQNRSAPECL